MEKIKLNPGARDRYLAILRDKSSNQYKDNYWNGEDGPGRCHCALGWLTRAAELDGVKVLPDYSPFIETLTPWFGDDVNILCQAISAHTGNSITYLNDIEGWSLDKIADMVEAVTE